MAKHCLLVGTTSWIDYVRITDMNGSPITGLVFTSTGLLAKYVLAGAASVAITLATQTVTGAYSSGGFVEVDATAFPGLYRLDVPNAAIASGNKSYVSIYGYSGMNVSMLEYDLVAYNPQDAVRLGLTALPNATAGAANGLPLSVDSSGRVDVLKINGTSQTARDIGASVLLSSGTGTGQLDFTSGVVKSNLWQILGTALTETAGQIAGAFKKLFDVAAPTLTCLDINQTGDSFAQIGTAGAGLTNLGDTRIANLDATVSSRTKPADTQAAVTLVATTTNLTNAPTAGDFTSAMKTSLNAATPASVAGAVGSVTGNVGGNVTGSVGSVVGAVGSVTGAVGSVTGNVGGSVASVVADVGITQSAADKVWLSAARSLTTFGTLVADTAAAVWAAATRTLTAFGFTVTTDVSATVTTNLDATVSSRLATSGYTAPPTANQNADAYLDRADAIETGVTPRQADRITFAAAAGVLSGAPTGPIIIQNAEANTKPRITATVDSDGNRTAVTLDLT